MGKQVVTKKGFSFLAFFLGLLLGIILIVGSIVGIIAFALFADLDSVFEVAGVKNEDEDGNIIYINTSEDGGVKNTFELINKLREMAGNVNALTLGEIEGLLPVTSSFVENIFDSISPYVVGLELDDVRAVQFSDFPDWLQDTVYSISPAVLLDTMGMSGTLADNILFKAMIYGSDADYVADADGNELVVWFDEYTLTDGEYTRSDGQILDPLFADHLVEEDGSYLLYFAMNDDCAYVLEKNDGAYVLTDGNYALYLSETAQLTGNYYNANGERITVTPITLATFIDGDPFAPLDKVYVSELIDGAGDAFLNVLGGITVGSILRGEIDSSITDDIALTDLMKIKVSDPIMPSIAFGVNGLKEISGDLYSGSYTVEGVTYVCYAETNNDVIKYVYYYDENGAEVEIPSATLGELNNNFNTQDIMDSFLLENLLDVNVDGKIVMYLTYSVTELTPAEDAVYDYTGTYHYKNEENVACTKAAYITVDADGNVTGVYFDEDCTEIYGGTTVSGVSEQLNGLTSSLKLKDVMTIDPDDKVMLKLGEYVIDDVSAGIDELTLDDFITARETVSDDGSKLDAIIMYMVYGVSDIEYAGEANYAYTGIYHGDDGDSSVYIAVTNGEVKGVYADAECTINVEATRVNDVSDRISSLTNDLTIGQLIDIDEDNTVLKAVAGSTISNLSDAVAQISINKLYADQIYELYSQTVNGETAYYAVATAYKSGTQYYTVEVSDSGEGESVIIITTTTVEEENFADGTYYVEVESDGGLFKVTEVTFSTEYIYYNEDGELINGDGKLTALDGGEYYTYGKATAFWKLLLYVNADEDSDNTTEKVYFVNSMTDMIDNISGNIQSATLRELDEAGIVVFENKNNLNKEMTVTEDGEPVKKLLGEFTLNELIAYIVKI